LAARKELLIAHVQEYVYFLKEVIYLLLSYN
jgi:hypothetical protein